MIIEKIKVINYKIFKEKVIELNDNVNIFVGENDAGKSTILEIISLITSGKINGANIDRQITASLAFDSTSPYSNVYENSTIKEEVENYKTALEGRMGAGKTIQEARLLTGTAIGSIDNSSGVWTYTSGTGELGALLDANETEIVYGKPEKEQTYWIGSSVNGRKEDSWIFMDMNDPDSLDVGAWLVDGWDNLVDGYFVNYDYFCLRPVIIVLKDYVTEVNITTVTFNLNGGNIEGNTANVEISGFSGTNINLPTTQTKDGCMFLGWYTSPTEGTKVYDANEITGTIPSRTTTVNGEVWNFASSVSTEGWNLNYIMKESGKMRQGVAGSMKALTWFLDTSENSKFSYTLIND